MSQSRSRRLSEVSNVWVERRRIAADGVFRVLSLDSVLALLFPFLSLALALAYSAP